MYSERLLSSWWALFPWIRNDSRICRSNDDLVYFRTFIPNWTQSFSSPSCISSRCLNIWLDIFSWSISLRCSNPRSYKLRDVSSIYLKIFIFPFSILIFSASPTYLSYNSFSSFSRHVMHQVSYTALLLWQSWERFFTVFDFVVHSRLPGLLQS